MNLPINTQDVAFIIQLIRKHIRKKERESRKPKEQGKLADGRPDFLAQEIARGHHLIQRLERACPPAFVNNSPDELV